MGASASTFHPTTSIWGLSKLLAPRGMQRVRCTRSTGWGQRVSRCPSLVLAIQGSCVAGTVAWTRDLYTLHNRALAAGPATRPSPFGLKTAVLYDGRTNRRPAGSYFRSTCLPDPTKRSASGLTAYIAPKGTGRRVFSNICA